MAKKNLIFEYSKELLKLFLNPGDKPNYPKEISIAKKLLKLYPEIDFWRDFRRDFNGFYSSLSYFLLKDSIKELDRKYEMWQLLLPKEKIVLENAPVILIEENKEKNRKSRNLLEFIDNVL